MQKDVEVGGIYDGVVTRIMSFGAFVDIGGGKEGLLHISKISSKRVDKVEDVLSVGDEITVKVVDIDNQDRINLSMKDLEVGNKIEASEEKTRKIKMQKYKKSIVKQNIKSNTQAKKQQNSEKILIIY